MIKKIFLFILNNTNANLSCKIINFFYFFRETKFFFDKQKNLLFAKEKERIRYFSDKMRGFYLYRYGIIFRGIEIAKSYFIDKINFKKDEIIIDIGANYGDLSIYFDKLNVKLICHNFEPEKNAFTALKLNNPNAINNNLAVTEKSEIKDFYLSTVSADSSIIPIEKYDEKIKIKTITLDDYILKNNLQNIKLLKIEAEGYEPEILLGLKKNIHKINYIAVDGGAERGVNKETTIEFIDDHLKKINFKLLFIDNIKNKNIRALYKNLKIE
jgi:FkbM family methyltransferase